MSPATRPSQRPVSIRIGHTLVEVLVALLVGALALTLMWALYLTGQRHSRKLEGRLTATQGIQLVVDRIRQDVAQTVFAPRDPLPLVESVRGGRSNQLNLLVFKSYRYLERPNVLYDSREYDPGWVVAQRVRYLFEPSSCRLIRSAPGSDEPLNGASFVSVKFTPNHLEANTVSPENSVTIELECPPDDQPSAAPGDPRNRRVPIVMPLQSYTRYLALDWCPNWFDLSVQVEDRPPRDAKL